MFEELFSFWVLDFHKLPSNCSIHSHFLPLKLLYSPTHAHAAHGRPHLLPFLFPSPLSQADLGKEIFLRHINDVFTITVSILPEVGPCQVMCNYHCVLKSCAKYMKMNCTWYHIHICNPKWISTLLLWGRCLNYMIIFVLTCRWFFTRKGNAIFMTLTIKFITT